MKRRDAFTLTELLVLAPVIAMLGAVLLASLGDAKQTVQAAACLSNMRQWGLAMGMYCDDYHDYMPYEGTSGGPIDTGFNLRAWYNVLSTYIGTPPLKNLYPPTAPDTSRIPLPGQKSIYVCPSVTAPASTWTPPATTSNPWFGYAMNRVNTGSGGHLYTRSLAALPGQVILLSESENDVYSFTDGYYLGKNAPIPVPPRHSGGMNFLFVDGHAQWYKLDDYSRTLSEATNPGREWSVPRAVYWFPCRTCNKT
ncbi:MAG: DUF1559 domain-containing protein [Verrucomicrobiia bacterium]|jgi:prepilin-type processing-associated H-X9-DG protein